MSQPIEVLEVYSTNSANDAELVRTALHTEGIKCEIEGENQAGLSGIGIMEIKLLVRAEDYDRARAFLDKHHHRH